MKKLLLITTCLFAMSSSVFAQHMSPAQQGFAYQQQMRMRQRQQQQNQIAQQRRQQAYNNRMRNKKWYGAIVKVVGTSSYSYATGHRSKRAAIREVMSSCKTRKCKVLATFANTCAMVAAPDHDQTSLQSNYVAFDKVGHNAIVKAMQACEKVHGGGHVVLLEQVGKTGRCALAMNMVYMADNLLEG